MRLAIVVPYRDREHNLVHFIPHMRNFIKNIEFKIFIIKQAPGKPFNRGKLLNVGAKMAMDGGYQYMALHDVDMLPVEADYSYVTRPTHMATEVQQFGYQLPYQDYFGGVTLFDTASYQQINGFHNDYWGWGGEDDDLMARCRSEKVETGRRKGKFYSLAHAYTGSAHPNHKNNETLVSQMQQGNVDYKANGLNTLEYTLLQQDNITQVDVIYTVEI